MVETHLENKVALVTGANSGIGAAIARALTKQGVKVAIHYFPCNAVKQPSVLHTSLGASAAEAIVQEIKASGGNATAFSADLLHPDSAAKLVDEVEGRIGTLDLLINNAAHCEAPDTIMEIEAGTIDRHFAVNVRAAILLTQEMAKRKRQSHSRDGSVVNISTDAARAFPGQIAYGASKAALEALTRSMAIELGPYGIRVNAVAPGPVQTGWITKSLEEQLIPSIPLGRVGVPEEIADAVVFLCSFQARWITGQIVQVVGGHTL